MGIPIKHQTHQSGPVVHLIGASANLLEMMEDWNKQLQQTSFGQSAIDYADNTGGQLQDQLDRSVTEGVTVDVEGWDIDLASPQEVQTAFENIAPITFPDPPSISRDANAEDSEEE